VKTADIVQSDRRRVSDVTGTLNKSHWECPPVCAKANIYRSMLVLRDPLWTKPLHHI